MDPAFRAEIEEALGAAVIKSDEEVHPNVINDDVIISDVTE